MESCFQALKNKFEEQSQELDYVKNKFEEKSQELDYVKNQFNEQSKELEAETAKRAFNEKAWQEFYLTVEKTIKQEIEEREKIHKEKEETVGMYKQYFAELTVERNVNEETIEYLNDQLNVSITLFNGKMAELDTLKAELDNLKKKIEELTKEDNSNRKALELTLKEMNKLQEKICTNEAHFEVERQAGRKRESELEIELANVKKQRNDSTAAAQKEIDVLKNALSECKAELETQRQENQSGQRQRLKLEEDLLLSKAKCEELSNRVKFSSEELLGAKRKIENLQTQLKEKEFTVATEQQEKLVGQKREAEVGVENLWLQNNINSSWDDLEI